jgi:hypothetical protein
MRPSAYRIVAFLAMLCVSAVSGAQQTTSLSEHGTHVKHKAEGLLSGSVATVFLADGEKKQGSFLAARATTLTLFDDAAHAEVELAYDSVRTIKPGTQKSRHRHAVLVIVLAAIAGAAIAGYLAAGR